MINASPPTERKARTGLLTPPTRICSARLKISAERGRFLAGDICGVLITRILWRSGLQPLRRVFRVVSEDYIRARALNARQNFQHDALFVEPTALRGGFDHGVFAAHGGGAGASMRQTLLGENGELDVLCIFAVFH